MKCNIIINKFGDWVKLKSILEELGWLQEEICIGTWMIEKIDIHSTDSDVWRRCKSISFNDEDYEGRLYHLEHFPKQFKKVPDGRHISISMNVKENIESGDIFDMDISVSDFIKWAKTESIEDGD